MAKKRSTTKKASTKDHVLVDYTGLLRVTEPMMHGPAVKRLQEFLVLFGADIDTDGVFGEGTESAVVDFQKKAEIKDDGICGPNTWAKLLDVVDGESKETGPMPDIIGGLDRVHDIRKLHVPPRLASQHDRIWQQIRGVTLHQTGCAMPSRPQGWSRLNAHFGITKEGLVVFANDPKMMIWHAQGLSRSTIGIEIEGNYPGLMSDPSTLWSGGGPEATLNPDMHKAFDQLFELLEWMFKVNRSQWWFVHAHRQAYKSRPADPGEEIWKSVALPWMKRLNEQWFEENRDGGDTFVIGSGRRIPREWDSRRTCPYKCKPNIG